MDSLNMVPDPQVSLFCWVADTDRKLTVLGRHDKLVLRRMNARGFWQLEDFLGAMELKA